MSPPYTAPATLWLSNPAPLLPGGEYLTGEREQKPFSPFQLSFELLLNPGCLDGGYETKTLP